MANLKVEIGVPQANPADIVAVPTVTDIGVPTNLSLVGSDHQPNGMKNRRVEVNPVARLATQKGIGVPFNPVDGATTT